MNKKIQMIITGLVTLLPSIAMAQLTGVAPPAGTARGDLSSVILNVINYVLGFVGVVALAYLIYGGFRYITSGGNEESITVAKDTIINAIIGIIVIGVSAALVNFVVRAVGGAVPAGAI